MLLIMVFLLSREVDIKICGEDYLLANPNFGFPNTSFNVPIETLFRIFSVQNILILFSSLINERRIVFISNDLQKLSSCGYAAVSMLYPFDWHFIYIPILPKALLSYCMAPMPFIVGIHSSSYEDLLKLPLEKIQFFNLDKNETQIDIDDLTSMPKSPQKHLKSVMDLEKIYMQLNGYANNVKLYAAFQQFFVESVGNYIYHFDKSDENDPFTFKMDEFTEENKNKAFIQNFCTTQMLSELIERKLDKLKLGQELLETAFEKKCSKLYQNLNNGKTNFNKKDSQTQQTQVPQLRRTSSKTISTQESKNPQPQTNNQNFSQFNIKRTTSQTITMQETKNQQLQRRSSKSLQETNENTENSYNPFQGPLINNEDHENNTNNNTNQNQKKTNQKKQTIWGPPLFTN